MAKDFSELEVLLKKVAKVVTGDEFRSKSSAFLEKYCDEFSYEDENKLEYSQIHDRYQEEIEVSLLDALPPEDVEKLLEQLPAYMESVSASDMDGSVGEALDLLTSLGDFTAFKELMLVTKRNKNSKAAPAESHEMKSTDLGVAGVDKLFKEMASATGQGGWEVKSDKGWFRLEAKKLDDGKEYFRSTLQTDLTPEQCFDLFMDYENPKRREWLSHIKSIKMLKDNGPDDKVLRNEIEFTGIMKMALAAIPKTMDTRGIVRRDFPEQGDKTVVVMPWNSDKDEYDSTSPFMKLQTICFKPVKDAPNECLLIIMEQTSMQWMPQWVQVMMMNNVSPKMMNNMITKYKKVMLGK